MKETERVASTFCDDCLLSVGRESQRTNSPCNTLRSPFRGTPSLTEPVVCVVASELTDQLRSSHQADHSAPIC